MMARSGVKRNAIIQKNKIENILLFMNNKQAGQPFENN